MTPPVLRLGAESRLSSGLCHGAQKVKLPTCLHSSPFDSQHSIQGTPTTRVLDHAHIQEASHHQRHTNPITEKERVQASKRDLARRPTASQRAARARARRAQRPRRRHSVWQRINASYAAPRLPKGHKGAPGHKRHLHDRARAAPKGDAAQKKWPNPHPTCCPTPAPI